MNGAISDGSNFYTKELGKTGFTREGKTGLAKVRNELVNELVGLGTYTSVVDVEDNDDVGLEEQAVVIAGLLESEREQGGADMFVPESGGDAQTI